MTDTEFAQALTIKLNLELGLPFLSEEQEEAAIRWCVDRTVHLIPDSIRQFILDAADGLSDEELGRLEDVLVAALNARIDVPWLPEHTEANVIRPVVQAVLGLAREGESIHIPVR